MTNPVRFFKALSERAYGENSLSDVTYAMCEADLVFKQFFLDFFFGRGKIDASKAIIEREHSEDWGRPDFYIREGGESYIVEVKIWDGNHHFKQYYEILRGKKLKEGAKGVEIDERQAWKRLGYIANYDTIKDVNVSEGVKASDICCVTTWKEFVSELEKYGGLNDPMINAYIGYIRNVCPFDDFNLDAWIKEKFVKSQSLKTNCQMILRISEAMSTAIAALSTNKDLQIGFKRYTRSPRNFISKFRMGHFFEFTVENNQQVWGWIGVYYRNDGGIICVEFENRAGWGKPVCDKFSESVKDGCLRYFLREECECNSEVITNFLNQVLYRVIGKKELAESHTITQDEGEAKKVPELLTMKGFPMLLEQKLFRVVQEIKTKTGSYKFRLASGNDAEVPNSHCGRYFELMEIPKNANGSENDNDVAVQQKPLVRGWVGLMYSKTKEDLSKHDNNGKRYYEDPRVVIELDWKFAEANKARPETGWYADSWGWKCYDVRIKDNCDGVRAIQDGINSLQDENNQR